MVFSELNKKHTTVGIVLLSKLMVLKPILRSLTDPPPINVPYKHITWQLRVHSRPPKLRKHNIQFKPQNHIHVFFLFHKSTH